MHYNTIRYHKRKAKMLEILGNKCIECGTHKELQVHHKDPNLKEFTISSEFSKPWDEILVELNKCELLCKNCHINKHRSKHGSLGRYSHYKCRCVLCKTVWNTHQNEWRWRTGRRTRRISTEASATHL